MAELTTTTELQKITTGLESFHSRKDAFHEIVEKAKLLKIKGIDDKEGYKAVKAMRIDIRKSFEIPVENEAKALRDMLTPVSKHISSVEKELLSITKEEKERLAKEELWFEEETEKIKAQKDAEEQARIQSRIDALASYGFAVDYILVVGMTEEQFNEKLNSCRLVFEAEQQRLANEKAAEDQARKDEEERLAKVAAEQARVQEEQYRIAMEQKEAQMKIDAELKSIADEKVRIEKEKQDAIDSAKRAEEMESAKKKAAEDAVKQAEESRKREQEEKEKKELAAKAKAERKAAMAPDKSKLEVFCKLIQDIEMPSLKSSEANQILSDAVAQLDQVVKSIKDKSEAL